MVLFTARNCEPPAQLQNWKSAPYRQSATVYSVYSQLPSISSSRHLHPQPEDAEGHAVHSVSQYHKLQVRFVRG
jgi:hypothetical protein